MQPREATETTSNTDEGKKENSQIGWVLQILSRLSQVERPHDDLMSLATVKALVGYLAHTRRPLPRDAIQCCREIGDLFTLQIVIYPDTADIGFS